MRHRIVCAAFFLLASPVAPLAAQVPDSSRVQLSTRGGTEVVGTLLSTSGGRVRMRPDGWRDTLSVPFDSVSSLKVSLGMQRHVRRDLLIGGGIGMLAGAVSAASSYQACTSWCIYDYGRGGDAAIGGVLGFIVGGAIGGVVGAIKHEEWRSVPLPLTGRASLMPLLNGGRVGLAGSYRF